MVFICKKSTFLRKNAFILKMPCYSLVNHVFTETVVFLSENAKKRKKLQINEVISFLCGWFLFGIAGSIS